eukprot:TRINITY_DN2580_c0_g1_i1.p1 TRINITY_DN2580_c0_g1~~TRINITY_DN2580_c0_g1_i1.p1  ORF type:complete len:369 (+),score=93.71 TRINITY_DN2580_c0_g1_i1:59-1108(+)
MGNGAGGGSDEKQNQQQQQQQQEREQPCQDTSTATSSTVTCTTTTGRTARPNLSLDIGSANSQNAYLNGTNKPIDPPAKGKVKIFRIPNPDTIEVGDKKLLKCAGRTIAVFRISEDKWAALDNACYHHGGPLFMGDIEEYNNELCVVCPWHCTKISVETGKSLYERVDVQTKDHFPQDKEGIKQRVHEVIVRGEDVLVKLNSAEEMAYSSDRYAASDIASNSEQLMNPDSVDAEASSKEKRDELVQRRRSSLLRERKMRQMEKERKAKNPVRVPPGQLTPRGDASKGPYRPSWVRDGELPPPIVEEDEYDDDEYLAFDLAEEFKDLEKTYDKRKEELDKQQSEKPIETT